MIPLWLVALVLGGAYVVHHRSDRVQAYRESGTVSVRAGVPYSFLLFWPKPAGNAALDMAVLSQALVTLMQQSVLPEMQETPTGMLVRFRATPPLPNTLVLGSKVVGTATLIRLTRLDGKDWDAP